MQTFVVLLDVPALYCCSSRTLSRIVAMLIERRLEIQTAQPSGVFFHLQVSHQETQSSIPLRDTDNSCQVYRCYPNWLAILGKGIRTGFGSSIAGYEYTRQEYATSMLQNNTLSPAPPCALPCLKPSISYLIVGLLGIFAKEQALSCSWFPSLLKSASIKVL
uniref:Uncharacterized protein n=1 Tax=Corvus moneduloides TaxID=1196302 RepID=A0A8C3H242_CORMO